VTVPEAPELADADPVALVAVTTASTVAPTSPAVSLSDDLVAPRMAVQLPARHSCH
jgi:hypothetical protein